MAKINIKSEKLTAFVVIFRATVPKLTKFITLGGWPLSKLVRQSIKPSR